MASLDSEGSVNESASSVAKHGSDRTNAVSGPESSALVAGSAEHLQSTFARAALAVDGGAVVWPLRPARITPDDVAGPRDARSVGEFRALRALVRTSATAYARRLRDDGTTPERMVVLVKAAATHRGVPGFSVRELTNDIVRWSIEAYFDD
jgi:hypothetical protein